MQFSYTITLADYRAALRLHERGKFSRRFSAFFWNRFLPIIGLILIAIEIAEGDLNRGQSIENLLRLLVIPIFFLLLPITRLNLIRKQFKQLFSGGSENMTIEMDDDRIVCTNPGRSETRYEWNAITSVSQDERITALFLAKDRFVFFPTAGLSAEQREELKALIQCNFVQRSLVKN